MANATATTLATVQEAGFASFIFMCKGTSSYPFCNLFYRQLAKAGFPLDSPSVAAVGITPDCGIPLAVNGRVGNVANTVICGICFIFTIYLSQLANRRRAAVGRIEFRGLLLAYALTLLFQSLTAGSFIQQGNIGLIVLTILHAASVALFFWFLVANALVATQIVEDGTPSSLIPYYGLGGIAFLVTAYIAADTAFGVTSLFKSNPPRELKNVGLFILLVMWPIVASLIFLATMAYVIMRVLEEKKQLLWYFLAYGLFIASQMVFFILGKPLCQASNRNLDSSFIATVLETACVGVLFLAWRGITESEWQDQLDTVYKVEP